MATKPDPIAAKAKKQKIVLGAVGAIFLVLALIQGPKLWKQINPPAPEAAAPAEAAATTDGTTPSGTAVVAVATSPATSGATTLTAVSVSSRPAAGDGQLTSFTLFEAKDPFEQQVSSDSGAGTGTTSGSSSTDTPPATGITGGGSDKPSATGGTPDTPKEPAPTYATIQVDGKASQLQVKGAFPQPEKLFVLVSLKKSSGKIGVKGGSFADGDLVKLTLGKPVTLMNTVTGTRYVVKLVYTGTQPENIEGFSPQPAAPAAPSAPAATGAPSATTTTSSPTAPTASGNG